MKRYLLFCQLVIMPMAAANAQLGIGADGLTIQSGTHFFVDSLTLNPSAAITLTNQTVTLSSLAVPGTPPSVGRVYLFSAPFDFSGTAGLYYKDSELNGNEESSLQIAYGNPAYTVTTTSTANPAINYLSSLFSATGIDRITAATFGALPVTLTHFSVENVEKGVHLVWKTTFETGSDFYEVQRSADAKTWEILTILEASRESQSLQRYSFTDNAPQTGINYYRLRIVDSDGTYAFSPIRNVVNEGSIAVKAFPNPAAHSLLVELTDWRRVQRLQLLDLLGKTWYTTDQAGFSNQIDTRNLLPGMYLVQVTYANSSLKTVKVVKQ